MTRRHRRRLVARAARTAEHRRITVGHAAAAAQASQDCGVDCAFCNPPDLSPGPYRLSRERGSGTYWHRRQAWVARRYNRAFLRGIPESPDSFERFDDRCCGSLAELRVDEETMAAFEEFASEDAAC